MAMTAEDRRDALRRANHFRAVQRIFRENVGGHPLETGRLLVREVIADPPTELGGMRAEKVVMAVRTIGIEKASAILRKAHISSQRKLRDLTDNERARLDAVLR